MDEMNIDKKVVDETILDVRDPVVNESMPVKKKPSRAASLWIGIGFAALAVMMNIIVSIIGIVIVLAIAAGTQGTGIFRDFNLIMEYSLKYAYELTAIYMIISFVIVFGVLKLRKIEILDEIRMKKIALPLGFVFLLFIPFAYALSLITNHLLDLISKYITLPGLEAAAMITNMNDSPLYLKFIVIAIIAPFFEEFLFRGVIQNELKKAFSIKFTIIFQAFLFGIYHLNITQGAYAFFLGLAFGYFAYLYNSVWAGIIMHMTINGSATVISHIYANQSSEVVAVSTNLLMIFIGIVMAVIFGVILYRTREKCNNDNTQAELND